MSYLLSYGNIIWGQISCCFLLCVVAGNVSNTCIPFIGVFLLVFFLADIYAFFLLFGVTITLISDYLQPDNVELSLLL